MDRDQSYALWQRCEETRLHALADGKTALEAHEFAKGLWNEWALSLMKELEKLNTEGKWSDDEYSYRRKVSRLGGVIGLIDHEIKPVEKECVVDWLRRAAIDLSDIRFKKQPSPIIAIRGHDKYIYPKTVQEMNAEQSVNFSGFIFPGEALFRNSIFDIYACFDDCVFFDDAIFDCAQFDFASFNHTKFDDLSSFRNAKIAGCQFDKAQFCGVCIFSGASLASGADFEETKFIANANFDGTIFGNNTTFMHAEFCSDADFSSAQFHSVLFDHTTFNTNDGDTSFKQAEFEDWASFENTKFLRAADFSAISAKKAFDLKGANFGIVDGTVPNFNQANFLEAPDLDGMNYPPAAFWHNSKANTEARYRALRRLAVEAFDHQNEAKAFKGEIRSKRGTEHMPWHLSYWIGIVYDFLSDFGRSIARPLLFWIFSIGVFFVIYLDMADKLAELSRQCTDGEPVWLKSLFLSIKNGLLFIGLERSRELDSAYTCLYNGVTSAKLNASSLLSFVQIGQNVLSAVLFFLFILGIRNNYKIK